LSNLIIACASLSAKKYFDGGSSEILADENKDSGQTLEFSNTLCALRLDTSAKTDQVSCARASMVLIKLLE
jgi:hypothetical protein